MPDETWVAVSNVIVPGQRLRMANHIEELAGSIEKNTLLHPITLRRDGGKLILVAGRRRLEATKFLRLERIRAKILDISETQAILAEIDENLQREELTELQRAQHIAERKRVWESIHPETSHGGTKAVRDKSTGKIQGKQPSAPKEEIISSFGETPKPSAKPESFSVETAKKNRVTPRTVRMSSQIGENICRKAQELLEGTPVEDRKVDLLKIARLDHAEQVAIAEVIHDGRATNFLRAKKILEAAEIQAEPKPLPSGPFRVIVADPPWHYEKRNEDSGKRENTAYATMTIDEIKGMEVDRIAEKDAVLWLWTTNSHLPEAFAVVQAWGFTYKTMLTWDKVRIGMGDWLRGQTEHCLMCVRGKPAVVLKGQTTLIRETSKEHSAKPEAFYQLVESLCAGSKVELFSRRTRDGWSEWGHESTGDESPESGGLGIAV